MAIVRLPDDVWASIKLYALPVKRWVMLAGHDAAYRQAFRRLPPTPRLVADVLNASYPPDAHGLLKEWWGRPDVTPKTPVDVAPLLERDEFTAGAVWNWFRVLGQRLTAVDWEVVQAYVACTDGAKAHHVEAAWDLTKPPFDDWEGADPSSHIFDVMHDAASPQQTGYGLGMLSGGGRRPDVWAIVLQTAQHITGTDMSLLDDGTVDAVRRLLVSGAIMPPVLMQLWQQARTAGRPDWEAELALVLQQHGYNV